MTPNIAAAMIKIAQSVPQLGKADRNNFAKYNYVSIDKYYETIARLAAANGISWQASEVRNVVEPDLGKDGAIRVTYSFSVYHESGDSLEEFACFTIIHPIQGAQTAGSALSYAEKLFMRSAFKVVTGEEDADATNPEDLRRASKAATDTNVKMVKEAFPDAKVTEVRKKPAEGSIAPDPSPEVAVISHLNKYQHPIIKHDAKDWDAIAAVLIRSVNGSTELEHVMTLWKDNMGVIEKMKEANEALHEEVRAAFSVMRKKYTKKDK
jgi:hypothetical protein